MNEPKTELAPVKANPVHHDSGPLASILDTNLFEHLWRVATAYSRSQMLPDQFRGKADDCFVGLQLALRLEVDPFMLFQSLYVVHGKPGMEAKLAIALCNARGPFSDRIAWKFSGEGMNRSCTAYAHDKATGNLCEQTVTMKIAEAEGWIAKNGSKWKTMPDMMLQYRSAAWLIRTCCPEVLMGMTTSDELQDTIEVRAEPKNTLREKVAAAKAEFEPIPQPEPTLHELGDFPRPRPEPGTQETDGPEEKAIEAAQNAMTDSFDEAEMVGQYKAMIERCSSVKEANKILSVAQGDPLLLACSKDCQVYIGELIAGCISKHKGIAKAQKQLGNVIE